MERGRLFRKAKDMETKVTKEVAEQEFERFAATARLDMDKPRNDNDRLAIDESRELFIYYVMKGLITVDDDGYATVHTECVDLPEVKFSNRPKVMHRRAVDRVKNTSQASQGMAVIADVVGKPTALLNKLDDVDYQVVELVYLLFLG